MKTSALLALLVLAPLAGATGNARPASTRPLQAEPQPRRMTFVAKYAAAAARPRQESLRERLQAVRQRYAGQRPLTPISLAREQRRLEQLRPLPVDTLGALNRRSSLGERSYASRDDRRLGSQARRELLSRPPALRGARRRR
jgi:hypothetical protein